MTTTSYNLMLLATDESPAPTLYIGVWASDVDPRAGAAPPLFTVTVPVNATDSDDAIIASVHAAVDAVLSEQDTHRALLDRGALYRGAVLPHTHSS